MAESSPEISAIRNGNRSAFPISGPDQSMGLTKREEIAARLFAGLLSNAHDKAYSTDLDELVKTSVRAADYLLIELEKRERHS